MNRAERRKSIRSTVKNLLSVSACAVIAFYAVTSALNAEVSAVDNKPSEAVAIELDAVPEYYQPLKHFVVGNADYTKLNVQGDDIVVAETIWCVDKVGIDYASGRNIFDENQRVTSEVLGSDTHIGDIVRSYMVCLPEQRSQRFDFLVECNHAQFDADTDNIVE